MCSLLITGLLVDAYDTKQATAIVDYRLDRLFTDT